MKALSPPKFRWSTELGQFDLTIWNANEVTISGVIPANSCSPFSAKLEKAGQKWRPCRLVARRRERVPDQALEATMLQAIIRSFEAWAKTHPNVFEFAQKLEEFTQIGKRAKPKKFRRKKITSDLS